MTKPPLLLLHGFGGAPPAWDEVRDAIAAGGPRRVIAPALFGHGPPRDDERGVATFDAEVDRVAALLPDGPVDVAGYSLGGRVTLGLLARHPGKVARAIVVGANPGLPNDAERAARREGDEGWAARLERDGIDAFFDAWEAQPLFATQRELPAAARARQRALRRGHDPARLAAAMRVLSLSRMPDYAPALAEVRGPVTWIAGERDPKFRDIARRGASLSPRGEARIVRGAGHNVVLEAPLAVASALEDP